MAEWFREAFHSHYLEIYAHRDASEAREMVALILRHISPDEDTRVLDAPCGAGRHSREFALNNLQVIGLDLSRDLITSAVAEEHHGKLLYTQGDLRHLPFGSESFHLVTNLFSSFGYFPTDSENLGVLEELTRVVRRGGTVVLDFFNAEHVRNNLVPFSTRVTSDGWQVQEFRRITADHPRIEKRIVITSDDFEQREVTESVRLFTPDELIGMLQACGLAVEHQYGSYSGEPLTRESPRAFLIGRKK